MYKRRKLIQSPLNSYILESIIMSNSLILSNENFGEVRVAYENNEPLFCLSDICRILEIQNATVVKNAILKAFIEHKKTGNQYTVSKLNISEAVDETIPVSKSSREKINALKNYATDRARFANKIINDNNNMIYNEL